MVKTNVLSRIFQIRVENKMGTCFTIDHNNKQYIITAKHIINNRKISAISIRQDHEWKSHNLTLVGDCPSPIDISVLAADICLSPTHLMPAELTGIIYGQEVFFLGFPYGIGTHQPGLNMNRPLPFIKKAILSASDAPNRLLYFDGHNNPGFSGGPIVWQHHQNQTAHFSVCGVISGFIDDDNGNSGIIVAYDIMNAIEVINRNPIGFQLIP